MNTTLKYYFNDHLFGKRRNVPHRAKIETIFIYILFVSTFLLNSKFNKRKVNFHFFFTILPILNDF